MRSIYWTRIISITNDNRKSHGHYFKTTRMRRTNSRCSIRFPGRKEDARMLLKIPKSECPDIWIRPPKHKWPKSWSRMEDLWQDYDGNGNLRIFFWYGWEKVPNWECLFVNREKDSSYQCVCTGYSWKTLIWENQHHSSIMFNLVALKENVRLARILWIITEVCSNPGFLAGLWKCQKQKPRGNLMPKRYLHGPMTWKVMQRNAWKDIANWRIKTTQQLYKVATPCLDDHQFKEEESGPVGQFSTVCSQVVLKYLYLARICRPDFLWSANKTCSCGHKWTKACDKCLARLISYIHHTSEFRQYCWKTLILQETLRTRSQHQEESYAFSEVARSCQ